MVLKSNEQEVCEVHGTALELGLATIAYGLFGVNKAYMEDRRDLFPHANSWVGGGCVASDVDVAQVHFCPLCREAEVVWKQVKKLLSMPFEAL
jgi:hypothetical protein